MPSVHPLLTATGIRKAFPGVLALDDVHLTLGHGEVLAVVGENGAGKSTLMKVIAGVYKAEAGTLHLEGTPIRFSGPMDAMQSGISLIHQELNLAENLTVQDNLFLGREPTYAWPLQLIDNRNAARIGGELLDRVGLPAEYLQYRVDTLAPGQKQLVEIARALGLNAKLLIMDEPTSSLTQRETDRLYQVIDSLKQTGVSVLYISHRLAEIKRCCDRAVVLRDGRNAGELAREEITHDNLVKLMVGRDLKQLFPRTRSAPGEVRLELENIRYQHGPKHTVSLTIRAGEVVGMAGLVGAGRTELAEAVFGLRSVSQGTIRVQGQPVTIRKPADAIRAGILLVPEDRRLNGLVLQQSVGFNLSLPNLDRISKLGMIHPLEERALHQSAIQQLRIKTPSAGQIVALLSGGNQQKIVFGKWLVREPGILILDEPTRGVDVGAKTEIYALIDELARQGMAVWMITSDMEELLGVSDRVVVMHEGRLTGELSGTELTEEMVMRLATGGGA